MELIDRGLFLFDQIFILKDLLSKVLGLGLEGGVNSILELQGIFLFGFLLVRFFGLIYSIFVLRNSPIFAFATLLTLPYYVHRSPPPSTLLHTFLYILSHHPLFAFVPLFILLIQTFFILDNHRSLHPQPIQLRLQLAIFLNNLSQLLHHLTICLVHFHLCGDLYFELLVKGLKLLVLLCNDGDVRLGFC